MIALIILLYIISLYFHFEARKPIVYEYSNSKYCIRSNDKYLDLQSYACFQIIIWKHDRDTLMQRRCTSNNLDYVKGVLNEL